MSITEREINFNQIGLFQFTTVHMLNSRVHFIDKTMKEMNVIYDF